MAERSLPKRLLVVPRFPVVARVIALAVLLGVVAVVVVYLYTRQAPAVARPEEPELSGEVTAIFENFKHLETKDGKNKYLLTAAVAKAYANGSHEMTNVELVSFGADGESKDRVTAERGIYNQAETLVVFEKSVKVDTDDGMHVESDRLRYNQESQVLELQGAVKYARQNLEGSCTGAIVETLENRVRMLENVDMTFHSSDEKAAKAPAASGPVAEKPKGEKKRKKNKDGKKGGKKGGGGKRKAARLAAAGGASGGASPIDFSSGPRIPVRVRSGSAVFDKTAGTARYDGNAVATRGGDEMRGATLLGFLTAENRIDRIEARGAAYLRSAGKAEATAPSMDFRFAEGNQLQTAVATGGVKLVSLGDPPVRTLTGERAEFDMAPGEAGSELRQARADGQAVVTVDAPPATPARPNPSARELKGDHVVLDMHEGGQFARRAEARDNAVLTVTPVKADAGVDRKRIVAPHMVMEFFEEGNLARQFDADGGVRIDLEPLAADGRVARTTTSATARAEFDRESQDMSRVEQSGDFKYVEGERNAVADRAVYTTADDLVTLRGATASGRPTVWDSKARTQADEIDIRSKAGTSAGRGDVRTTYYSPESTGNATPFGKTKSPVFLTAARVDARDAEGGSAVYTGNARAWQDDNFVKAETIRLFHDAKRMEAEKGVETALYKTSRKDDGGQVEKVPVFTTAERMVYWDGERRIHYEGGVYSRQAPDELKSSVQDVWLTREENASVDKLVATGEVLMTEPGRTGRGEKLVYTGSDQKAVLSGPSSRVDDVEQGTTTGQELTFYVGGERIRVAGRNGAGRVKSVHRIGKGGSQ